MRANKYALVAPAVSAAGVLALALATALSAQELPTGVVEARSAAPAQKNPLDTPQDAELGRKTFVTSGGCSYCHSNDGTGGRGANLTLGEYRFGGSDDQLFETIRNGIPGSDMPSTFDYKPMLAKYHGKPLEGKGQVLVRQGYPGPLMKSPYEFKQYGQSGKWVSELFPNIGGVVDDLAFIHSAQGRSADHTLSHYEWNTGMIIAGYPSMGAWITYGLGSENQSLPAFVVIHDPRGGPFTGSAQWSSGFLPAAYQGSVFRSAGDPILDLHPPDGSLSPEQQRAELDELARINQNYVEKHPGISELTARISSYELAFRMQGCAPEAINIDEESEETKRLYGLDNKVSEPFGRQCLMARRLVERGVRAVQLWNGAVVNQNVDTWDAHNSIVDNHGRHAPEVDKPIAGLITDLKRRGLLNETLVLWHSEFGRMPLSQKGIGRDHNPGALTVWMAGAGVKGGQTIGASDEFGYKAAEQIVTAHDLHASILYLLGIDHKRLTYYYNGRNMRLTDVAGELIPQITG